MRRILLTAVLCFQFAASYSHAQESVGPYAQLNRLSRVLRGYAPSESEKNDLRNAIHSGQEKAFLDKKLDDYLRSDEHAYKMSTRLEELFHLQTGSTPIESALETYADRQYSGQNYFYRKNSLNFLFNEIARKNLSWDELLTGKTYRLFYTQKDILMFTDWGFMAGVLPNLPSYNGVFDKDAPTPLITNTPVIRDVKFNDQDPRIAGAITTNRFFSRYTNTGINKNRRRAAAIFRIFLCDSMSAAVSSSEGMEEQILDLMFPHGPETTENNLRKALVSAESLHGTQPDCMACHYKLDPMGKTLLTSQSALSPKASPGRLTYKKANGMLVDVPVKGIGELGRAITQQEEYKSCQVQHFWKWFMGDRTLSAAKKEELIAKFDQVGRRTNDFIKIIIQQPEFFSPRIPFTEMQSQARMVKGFLKKCQDCHKDQFYEDSPDFKFPDFTQWPIGGSRSSMKSWIEKIARNMDLGHDGENPRMPSTTASWRSSYKEVQLMKKWISQGAPDENGSALLTMEGGQ